MKILVINGPNLNMLPKRDEIKYSSLSIEQIMELLKEEFPKIEFHIFPIKS